jgi:hypothetical protein
MFQPLKFFIREDSGAFYIITFRNLRFPRKFFNRFLERDVAATILQ